MGKIINVASITSRNPDCDCDAILNRFTNIENDITNVTSDITDIKNDITNIQNEITNIRNEIAVGAVTCVTRTTANTPNSPERNGVLDLGVCVINVGLQYNFWGTGAIGNRNISWNGGSRYTLAYPYNPITGAPEFPELAFYQGTATIGTAWFQAGGGATQATPIYADNTGIYLLPTNTLNPTNTSYFRFTLMLILG